MSLRDEWKNTGKGLGQAFKGFGKNIARSVNTGLENPDAVFGDEQDKNETSTVFNDGSWRETGKELGSAFLGLGKSILSSAKTGLDAIDGPDEESDEKSE